MASIIDNSENFYTGNSGSEWTDWAIPIFCILLGFVGAELLSYIKSKKTNKETWLAFHDAVADLEESMIRQLANFNNTINSIGQESKVRLDYYFTVNLIYLQSIKRDTVTAYELKYQGKGAAYHTGKKYEAIALLEIETERTKQLINEFDKVADEITKRFFVSWNKYYRQFRDDSSTGQNAEFILAVLSVYDNAMGGRPGISEITHLLPSLLQPLAQTHDAYSSNEMQKDTRYLLDEATDYAKELHRCNVTTHKVLSQQRDTFRECGNILFGQTNK